MENFPVRDVTDVRTHPLIVPATIRDIPDKPLVDVPPRVGAIKPMHVRSLAQMRAYAKHVALCDGKPELGLVADPGLGKSTLFPLLLAKSANKLVVIVEFCNSLAENAYLGLMKARDASEEFRGVGLAWYGDQVDLPDVCALKTPHVLVISARKIIGRVARNAEFPPALVLHDESHYSDYSTFTLRSVVMTFPWVKAYVAMSATLTPDVKADRTAVDGAGYQRRDVEMVVPPVRCWVDRGVASDAAVPWAVKALYGRKTLVFSDDKEANSSYGDMLATQRLEVFHLHVGHLAPSVHRVRTALENPDASVVVFADTPYRNGYNFNLDIVIDCGMVREEYISDNRIMERYRLANRTEILQGAARVGRAKTGVVYRNKCEYPSHIPLLALGEVRHAAAAHVLMGFRPPPVLCQLVPEVKKWTVRDGQRVIQGFLEQVLTPPNVEETVGFAPDTQVATRAAADSSGYTEAVYGGHVRGLDAILDRVRTMELGSVHVDDAFPSGHPGARYDVPHSYTLVSGPYWVRSEDAERMMRRLLAGEGRYDVAMLSTEEVQWFAVQLTSAWNTVADTVTEKSLALSAVRDMVESGRCMEGYAWSDVRKTHADVAFHLRELESILALLRAFYSKKPFTVRYRDMKRPADIAAGYAVARRDVDAFAVGSLGRLHNDRDNHGTKYHFGAIEAPYNGGYTWQRGLPKRDTVRITNGSDDSDPVSSGSRRA